MKSSRLLPALTTAMSLMLAGQPGTAIADESREMAKSQMKIACKSMAGV